ncbi:MAG TPA: hypothetical protein P5531_03575 [Bacteroidales bacterium]|nr:hypothetical protein [Bacteroidales bacterium]HSA42399.1 hypothetical protein [Bacteroidales bacterium]
MKTIKVLIFSLLIAAACQLSAQEKKAAPVKKETKEAVKPAKEQSSQQTANPQKPRPRPPMTREDSLKRQHKIDSLRKVFEEKRSKEGTPKMSKEDSLKRAARIDSLRKVARERNKTNPNAPKMSKQDSLKRAHKLDSLRKANADRKAKEQKAPGKK